MFVWYIPFVLLGLIGIDRFVEQKKYLLLTVSVTAIILISYMYSPTALIGLFVYYIYRILEQKPFSVSKLFVGTVPFIIGIMISAVLLVPTALIIFGGRISDSAGMSFSAPELIFPSVKELFYRGFTPGLTFIMLFSIFTMLFSSKRQDRVFSAILLILTLAPVSLLLLNGGLYIRGKILIALIPLYPICFCSMLERCKEREKLIPALISLFISFALLLVRINISKPSWIALMIVDAILTAVTLAIYFRFRLSKKSVWKIVAFSAAILLAVTNIAVQLTEDFVSISTFAALDSDNGSVKSMANKVAKKDSAFYRSTSLFNRHDTVNLTYADNWFGTSIYSSTSNPYFIRFYNEMLGNNIQFNNDYIDFASTNPLFNSFMGVKYIYAPCDPDELYYDKIDSQDGCTVFENKFFLPLIYTHTQMISEDDYLSLSCPDQISALFGTVTVDGMKNSTYIADNVSKIAVGSLKDTYVLDISNDGETMTVPLDEPIDGKFVLVRFSLNHNPNYDIDITVNGVNNLLSESSSIYHNHNNVFEYVLSSKEPITELVFSFTKGHYDFSDISVHTLDISPENVPFIPASDIVFDSKNSVISSKVSLNADGILATTLPYDNGYRIYIDGKETELLRVNTAFIGCEIPKGEHEIRIVYRAPGFALGKCISVLGVIVLFSGIIVDNVIKIRRKKSKNNITENI